VNELIIIAKTYRQAFNFAKANNLCGRWVHVNTPDRLMRLRARRFVIVSYPDDFRALESIILENELVQVFGGINDI